MSDAASSIDQIEIDKFEQMAAEWWDPTGKFKPLHIFNPVRLTYIKERTCAHFGLDPKGAKPFAGLRFLDVGCGGGLLCEPMARLGASIVGIDPAPTNIEVARLHAQESGLAIDYRATTAEALAESGETFDVVLNMEVVEHVASVPEFVATCASMARPSRGGKAAKEEPVGLMYLATINRTPKAFALAIVGAEYVLQWLPRGTHQYEKLVKPGELEAALDDAGMQVIDETGVTFNPLSGRWSRSRDMDVNYMLLAERSVPDRTERKRDG